MKGPARSRSPVPGRTVLCVLCWVAAGCSLDEPTIPKSGVMPAPAIAGNESGAAAIRRFSDLDDDSLWARVERSAGLMDVGLRQPGRRSGMSRGRVIVAHGDRVAGRAAVAAIPGVDVIDTDSLLPILKVRVRTPAAMRRLRRLPQVEYAEPGAFTDAPSRHGLAFQDLELGCSVGVYGGPGGNGWAPITGDVLPWNYRIMAIDSAWNYSSGRGVRVGLVDTGVDEGVRELNEDFATGWSTGRTFDKTFTSPAIGNANPWHDTCGHGTRMASVVAAPRNSAWMLGVAYGADLLAVRVDNDVILNQVSETRMGIRIAATSSRIVTLAFGSPFYYSSIAQELEWWYYNSDVVAFAAAGTSPCWDAFKQVVFPGNLPYVTTVTGFDGTGSLACNAHYGPDVDFAAFTDQPAVGLSSLGHDFAGLSGSSGATAVLAGMAALYFSKNPSASRTQLLSALTVAASPTGGRSPLWGFGVPNALCLMGELCTAWIEGPTLIQTSGMYTWTVYQRSSPGPVTYQWSSGEKTQTISRYISVTPGMPEYLMTLSVTVRDKRNGRTRIDSKPVVVRDPYGCPTCF